MFGSDLVILSVADMAQVSQMTWHTSRRRVIYLLLGDSVVMGQAGKM